MRGAAERSWGETHGRDTALPRVAGHPARPSRRTSPSLQGGSVAIGSAEMELPSVTATRTAPSGKAHFAAATAG